MKNITRLFLLCSLAIGCKTKGPEMLTVKGVFIHAPGKKIMLAEIPYGSPQRIVADSAMLDSTGKFSLSTIQQQEGLYQLLVDDGPSILFINDTNMITVNADATSDAKYKIEGSPASQSLKSLYEQLTALQKKQTKARIIADSIAKAKMPDSLKTPYYQARDNSKKEISKFLIAYTSMEKNPTALYYGLGIASQFLEKQQWALQLEKALALYPKHPGLTLMKVSIAATNQQEEAGKQLLNKQVPDISLPDTSGKKISVSSFKGKWLLIDFWASWCGPCRADNPNVVAAYRQFKNKNFTILGVSLDKDRAAWTKAIRKDSLSWTQVSDLKFWDSEAVSKYRFASIPFNILVDTAGKTIAVNLHGNMLKQKLQSVLK